MEQRWQLGRARPHLEAVVIVGLCQRLFSMGASPLASVLSGDSRGLEAAPQRGQPSIRPPRMRTSP